jgi:TPR repeat protein
MIHKYLVAGALLGLISSAVSAETVHDGIVAWQHADYARAVAIWRPLAERGSPDAAYDLAQAYRLGRGVPLNLAAAQTWFERAAAKGHVDAAATLGLMLFENGDRAAGARWLRQAAEKGEPRALLVYGTALFNGDGVKRDPILGYAYVSRAAAQGFAPAQAQLEQLDQVLPVEQRKQALAIAMAKAKANPPPSSKPVKPAPAPGPKPAVQATAQAAPPPVPASGNWRIQLGAFSQRTSAEALFKKLSGQLAGRQPVYVSAGAVTRLQVGPYATRSAAAAACSQLHGQACFPVPAQ